MKAWVPIAVLLSLAAPWLAAAHPSAEHRIELLSEAIRARPDDPVSYMRRGEAYSNEGRFDLAHVEPDEGNFDALGKGVEEGKAPASAPASKYLSKGLTRSRTDKLVVMAGGGAQQAASASPQPSNVTAFAGGVQGAVALKGELEAKLSPAQALENLPWQARRRTKKLPSRQTIMVRRHDKFIEKSGRVSPTRL